MTLALATRQPGVPRRALLRAGFTLDGQSIARLRELGVPAVWVRHPELDGLVPRPGTVIADRVADILEVLGAPYDEAARRPRCAVTIPDLSPLIERLHDAVLSDPHGAPVVEDLPASASPLAAHACAVGVLVLLVSMRLPDYLALHRRRLAPAEARNPVPVVEAALFHEIGMARLPDAALDALAEHGDETAPACRAHARLGFELVSGVLEPAPAAGVLHHHQRYDGSGFPPAVPGDDRGLAGERIHVFARILAVADAFEHARRPVWGPDAAAPARPPVRALRQVRDLVRGQALDPLVFRALLSVVPAYTPGAMVTLSNGADAVVTGWDPGRPCRPRVRALSGGATERPDLVRLGAEIDLREHPALAVASSEGVRVLEDNFDPRITDEFDLRAGLRALLGRDAPSPKPVLPVP